MGLPRTRLDTANTFWDNYLALPLFFSMSKFAKKNNLEQVNNEQFFYDLDKKGGGAFKLLKDVVNSLVAIESIVFSRIPSPNVHLVVVKK